MSDSNGEIERTATEPDPNPTLTKRKPSPGIVYFASVPHKMSISDIKKYFEDHSVSKTYFVPLKSNSNQFIGIDFFLIPKTLKPPVLADSKIARVV